MRTTIKDIAEKAGISIAAVSTILNNKPSRISEKTKKRVLEIASELNYRPNHAAVNLKSNRSFTIGLIVSDIRNGFYSSLAKGAEDKCRENGWNVILCNSGDYLQREKEYIEVLDSKGVDGIILNTVSTANLDETKKTSARLIELGIPFVNLDLTTPTPRTNAVVMDHRKGGYLATKHLIDLGHRRIACITGSLYLEGAYSRYQGYKDALLEHGIPIDEGIIYKGDYRAESGMHAMEYLEGKDYSAVFSFNDYMAFMIYRYLQERGRSIPNDCSIVGYDDDSFALVINPPLTTIRQPIYDMGQAAAQIIFDIVDHNKQQPIIMDFEPRLIVRGSTAAYQK